MRRKRIALGRSQATGRKNKFRMMIVLTAVFAMLFPLTVFAAAPVFTQTGPFAVIENSSTGTLVGTVVATEATSYAIMAGNGTGGGAFSIDNGGNIRVADGTQIDFETTPQFNLTVQASNTDGSTQATVTINVLNVNDPPQMDAPSYDFNVNENEPNGTLVGQVSATDNDSGDTLVYSILLATPPGIFSIDSDDGEIRIADTSQINFESGTTEYTIFVQASDGGLSDVVPVTITIDDANDAPVAVADGTYDATEDTVLDVNVVANGVLANDTDEDQDPADTLTAVLDDDATHGTVVLNADGTFTYTPDSQYDGPDSFTYHANDGTADSNIVTVTINVVGSNDQPTANDDDGWSTDADTPLNVPAPGVLENDTDPELDSLTVSTADTASAQGATVSVAADGSFSYDPSGAAALQALGVGDAISDTFSYTASDGGLTDTAVVSITVNGVNDAPTITEGISVTVDMDEDSTPIAFSLTLNATDPDGDTITWSILSDGTNGTATASGIGSSKAIGYTPDANYNGTDSFVVQIDDGSGGADTITVNVNIAPQNDPPTANDDTPTVNEQSTNNTLNVLANDTILPDSGETLTITDVGATNNGGTVTNTVTAITYTPDPAFIGTEVFTYTITDGTFFDTATVTVTVQDVNFPPIITEGASIVVDMDEDSTPIAFSLTLNATDPDGDDPLTWSIFSQGGNGTATATGDGFSKAIGYTPNANYNGSDSFIVQVSDNNGGIDTITVNVNIAPQNDNPDAVDDNPTVNEDSTNNILDVLANDTDAPDSGETLTITAVGATNNGGSVTNNGTNITYTPVAEFSGTEVFTYTIGDGNGGSDTATVTVNVQTVNDDPIITEGISVTVDMDEDSSPTAFALTLNVTDIDSSTFTWSISSAATNGLASASGTGASKAIGYTPNADYNGTDSFIVQVQEEHGGVDTITVNVNIAPINDNPVAVDDSANTPMDTAVPISVLINDTDIDADSLSVISTTNGSNGTTAHDGTTVTYTPAASYEGPDSFTYTISDGNGGSDTATVTVTVGKSYIYLPMIIKAGPQAPDLVVTSLTATNETVEVVVTNQGPVDTGAGFWVDFYINPSEAPTHANQLWQDLGSEGIAWGVTIPIAAGESLTLTYSTAPGAPNLYYSAADSNFTGTMSVGTSVYAQVDSAHVSNVNGAILETHEISGAPYNNVSSEVFSTTVDINSSVVEDASNLHALHAKFELPLR